MENMLEKVLLNSGTGIIEGYFRFPYPITLITYENYCYHREFLDNSDNKRLHVYKDWEEDFEIAKAKILVSLSNYESYFKKPVINLSMTDGKFLGTYLIKKIHDPGNGESDGQYEIDIRSEQYPEIKICLDTNQMCLNSSYGTCFIRLDGESDKLLKFN